MAKGRARLTGFARFVIFLLVAAPLSIFIASYAKGENGVQNILQFFQQGKEQVTGLVASQPTTTSTAPTMATSFLGLRTTIYKVPNLATAKKWYTKAFQTKPYFDEPSYIGFNIAGFELGLQLNESAATATAENVLSYWGVEDIQTEFDRLLDLGATAHEAPQNVGGSIMVATVKDPWGNIIGLIYNPEFKK